LKAITLDNSQQNSLLRLAQEGISVYSPHTAVDAAPGGLNEWLADIVTAKERSRTVDSDALIPHSLSVVTPVKDVPEGFDGAGYGRVVRFQTPQTLSAIIRRIADHLGVSHVNVAVPQTVHHKYKANIEIHSVGICAGSGGSVLNGLDVDLLFTGEMGHHEALAAIEQGRCVITAFHSNTERGFLASRMKSALEKEIEKEIHAMVENKEDDVFDTSVSVEISQKDRDPFVIVNAEDFY
jgi:putative NIF3 family GTP cyclohydrolase 1 type 2